MSSPALLPARHRKRPRGPLMSTHDTGDSGFAPPVELMNPCKGNCNGRAKLLTNSQVPDFPQQYLKLNGPAAHPENSSRRKCAPAPPPCPGCCTTTHHGRASRGQKKTAPRAPFLPDPPPRAVRPGGHSWTAASPPRRRCGCCGPSPSCAWRCRHPPRSCRATASACPWPAPPSCAH